MSALSRKEFYDLALECRERALVLANHDQSRVNRLRCREFNQWLEQLKRYDELADELGTMPAARPITRWQLIGAATALWIIGSFIWGAELGPTGLRMVSLGAMGTVLLLFFLPEDLYGTTVEKLEGKLLRIVYALEKLLHSRKMGLTEAVFFQVKENLEAARKELRQQIDLAHR